MVAVRSQEPLQQQMSGALLCPICGEVLGFGATDLWRCSRFHCFHAQCVGPEGCPDCEEPMARVKSTEQLGALLWLAGLRDLAASIFRGF